ncbi:MAG: SBBP repeat-containing protein [Chthoniobacterales bacterium]
MKFLSRGSGYNLFLTNREAVLVLSKPEKPAPRPANKATRASLSQEPKRQSTVLRTQLIAANPAGKVTGEEELAGKVNYFIGRDPAKWRTDVATYAKIRYEEVYPGIDLVYYGNQGQLEYDFVVGPGADPARIGLKVAGAQKVSLNGEGQLVVQTAGGTVRWDKPTVYQQAGGERRAVKGKYVLRRGHELGFEVAAYDTTKPLIIDPTLVYSTFLGGSNTDFGYATAVDTAGNAYVTGNTSSKDFPTTPGVFQQNRGQQDAAFVTELNPTGTAVLYSTYLGGNGSESGYAIAVDTAGKVYLTGNTSSSDFPTTPEAFQTTFQGTLDVFVTELNATGSALLYSTYLGGSDFDYGFAIAVGVSGNAFVTGETTSANFPTTTGAFQTTYGGGLRDAFVTELNPTGTGLIYSTYLGGSGEESGTGMAVDTSGNAYVTGSTGSSDFPTTAGAFQTTKNGVFFTDAFVTKLNPTGTGLLYSTYLGGIMSDQSGGIVVDTSGNAYITGTTSSSDFPTTAGAYQTTRIGEDDAFVTELNPSATGLSYSTYLGGSVGETGTGIAVNTSGNAYVTGQTSSPDFPTTAAAFQTTYGGGLTDAFVTELNPTGASLLYSTYFGGSGFESGRGIAVGTSGNAYLTGLTGSSDFPTTAGAFQTTFGGGVYDAFVAKFETVSQIVLTASRRKMGETVLARLVWTGATSTKIDIYRDGVQIAEVRNTGRYSDSLTVSGTYTYKVCEVGGAMNCSNEVTVRGP